MTALAGFLDARQHQGQWLLRIDDLDTPRNVKGSVESIVDILSRLGLYWDQPIYYQSQSLPFYQSAIDKLLDEQLLYPCNCSRKLLAETALKKPPVYPGFCRNRRINIQENHALRIKTDAVILTYQDQLQGQVNQNLKHDVGDFIVKRKDQIIAYQFAVVIDDHQQNINHVLRGNDLLDSTPRQLYLQKLLGFDRPSYLHVPVVVDLQGKKLSKQTYARAVNPEKPEHTLFLLLTLLKQNPSDSLRKATVTEILEWAVANWNPLKLQKVRAIESTID